MTSSIELQIISKILTEEDSNIVNTLCEYGPEYYSLYRDEINFILDHRQKYGNIPDVFTFQAQFEDINLVQVNEPIEFLKTEMIKNRQLIILMSTFNKIKDLGSGDVTEAWQYIGSQYEQAMQLDSSNPMDLIKDAKERSAQVIEYSKQARIPSGFPEIDKIMYGGLSTVEELLLIVARTNTGKSWVCTKMMESAQGAGFPVLYYSPEMQASFLGTRFDTWRGHFQNSQLFKGQYSQEYYDYINNLTKEDIPAFILEDKDTPSGDVSVRTIETFVKRHRIKLVIVDGLSYMVDIRRSSKEYDRYKNICNDLFKLSKRYGCAVVVAMQANRATNDSKDDKGEPIPSLYNVEGSDHPARICTQAFALRQIFEKNVLDIRLEKSRNANNQKPIFSYAWDVNTGNARYLPGSDDSQNDIPQPSVDIGDIVPTNTHFSNDMSDNLSEEDWGDDVEF